jgi:hypothetical protein
MIVLTTFLIGMSVFQFLVAFEWLRRQWRSLDELFKRPLYSYQREPRRYMLPPELIHQYPAVDRLGDDCPLRD